MFVLFGWRFYVSVNSLVFMAVSLSLFLSLPASLSVTSDYYLTERMSNMTLTILLGGYPLLISFSQCYYIRFFP